MKAPAFARLLTLFCIVFALTGAASARGEDLIVEHDPADGHFATIQAAIDHAEVELRKPNPDSFRIRVRASSEAYRGPIRLKNDNVPIIGDSTSGTFIEGGSSTLIEAGEVDSVTIRNFTFRSASLAISVENSDGIDIRNNVFELGRGATAIQLSNSSNGSIVNNTFYNNGTAISTASNVKITNNIFANNQTAISTQVPLNLVSYNLFFDNGSAGVELDPTSIPYPATEDADPRFVDRGEGDFHLQEDSPAKGSGNPSEINSFNSSSDMGAYGGQFSDIPLTGVTGLSATFTSPDSVTLNWTASPNAAVTGYRVYYGAAPGSYQGTGAAEGPSPIFIPGRTASSATLSGLPTSPQPPAAPLLRVTPQNQALQLDWNQVPGASGYLIYYSTTPFTAASLPDEPAPIRITTGNITSYRIPDLANGTPYYVAIRAVAGNTLFVAVTAVIDAGQPPAPGSANESGYTQASVTLGQAVEVDGAPSEVLSATPQPVIPYPNLSGEGCFIATAAYGFYSAPQVQLLRDFRDRFLMPHAAGRAFVSWYYRYGPAGAAFINSHPWLKPPVRLALFPLVTLSFFLLKTPWQLQFLLAAAAASLIYRRRINRRREKGASAEAASEGGAA